VPIRYYQDDNGYLVYENTNTGAEVHVWDGDLETAIDICSDWHGGRSSPSFRLMGNDFSYRNLRATLKELQRVQKMADAAGDVDGEDYLELLTTIEDLEGIVSRIDKIAD